MAVNPIPDGYHTITPYLIVEEPGKLSDFLQRALGAEEMFRMTSPEGSVTHVELKIGDSMVMMGRASADYPPTKATYYLYVEDVDAVYQQAVAAGGVVVREPQNELYGDRSGGIKDPAGNQWWVATHVEDVSAEELDRRFREPAAG